MQSHAAIRTHAFRILLEYKLGMQQARGIQLGTLFIIQRTLEHGFPRNACIICTRRLGEIKPIKAYGAVTFIRRTRSKRTIASRKGQVER
jgi:hypothetical protein